jgi:hypothetical protein
MPNEHVMVLKYRLTAIASEAAAMLPRLRLAGVKALLDSYGATCPGCTSLPDHLRQLVAQMHLPVRVSAAGRAEPLPEGVAYGAIALALVHVADEPVDGVGGVAPALRCAGRQRAALLVAAARACLVLAAGPCLVLDPHPHAHTRPHAHLRST